VLLLASAFQPVTRPNYRYALRDAVLISFSSPLLFLAMPWLTGRALHGPTGAPGFLLMAGPLSLLLCSLRTCLILLGDRRHRLTSTNCLRQELSHAYRGYIRNAGFLGLLEAGLLILAGLGLAHFNKEGLSMLPLALLYGATAIYILIDQSLSNTIKVSDDIFALRAQYCRALIHRNRSRRFLSWLWLAPALLVLHVISNKGILETVEASVAAVLLCFLATAINRESSGRAAEEVDLLARLEEKRVSA
jgi:hypothetical protein